MQIAPFDLHSARQAVAQYVHHCNTVRFHSAIGYVTPHTKLAGKENNSLPSEIRSTKRLGKDEGLRQPIQLGAFIPFDSGENTINPNAGILKIPKQISGRYPFRISADQTEIQFT